MLARIGQSLPRGSPYPRDHSWGAAPGFRLLPTGGAPSTREHRRGDILTSVEIFFTALMVLVMVLTTWFAVYVVYRLYSDNR